MNTASSIYSNASASGTVHPYTLAPASMTQTAPYSTGSDSHQSYATTPEMRHQDVHISFLAADRPQTQFIGDAALVQEFIQETFKRLIGESFPKNLYIVIASEAEISKHHTGVWSRGILGFSLNRQGQGVSEIYIKENDLDTLMLAIGHEIGHVMSPTLPSIHDEEAKAFAFELAWVQTLIKHNIAGLSQCFHPEPAHNGLHDIAYKFVRHALEAGHDALDIFSDIVWGRMTMLNTLEGRMH